ncbi:hypothetical protein NQ317_012093 [Molorchus minor]|uniref:Carcinine transporter n=1 Tax=Molorchus minor TaxID=1323400 RepID=A0ABQ9JKU6_9CUCU|nr:hypothetical protein NQ317_012093 [Molorchus minor]
MEDTPLACIFIKLYKNFNQVPSLFREIIKIDVKFSAYIFKNALTSMDLDEILPRIGEFGKYQKLVIWFILLPAVFPCGFHAYNQLFMGITPEHWCNVPELSSLERDAARNLSIPLETSLAGELRFSKCYMYDFNFTSSNSNYTAKGTEIIPCNHGWIYDMDNKTTSVVTEWNLVCDKEFSTTLALILLGASGLIGNYIFGYIQDGIGRRPAYFIYLLIQCIFGIATVFFTELYNVESVSHWCWLYCTSYTWDALCIRIKLRSKKFQATLGNFLELIAIELVGPKDRATVTILINIAYSLSLISLSIIVWVIRNWRWMSLTTTVPFFILFLHWWTLPESPRWLLAQGRYKEAEKILHKMARINGKVIEKDYISKFCSSRSVSKRNNTEHQTYGIRDLFSSNNLRWKTIIITLLWFTNTSVYVGLSYYAPALGRDEYLNFFLAGAVELPTYLFLWPAMERLGRRWTLCISMIIGGTSCLATFFVQNVLPLMASELYPTVVRGLGISFSSVIGMLGPIFIPLVNYLGADMLILPLIIMGVMLVIGGSCSLLLPETLNQHLPQTLQDAEKTGLDCFACCNPPQMIVKEKSLFETKI